MRAEDCAAVLPPVATNPERARQLGDAWVRHMRRGDFARAWEVSDEALRERAEQSCEHLPLQYRSVWDGRPLHNQQVLIRCCHGLGDTIQFIRYAPKVREIASRVTVEAQLELLPLLRTVRGIDEVVQLGATSSVPHDVEVEVMELPHVFRSTIATLPAEIPYLHVQPGELQRDNRLQVGLVWRCGDWAPERSIPGAMLAPLARIPNVALHIFQRGSGLLEWPQGLGVNSGSDDLLEAARRIAALDLMISVDSMPAHVAAALGVPIWTLLQAQADWRWMDEGENSPWYPGMRLFRQARAGEWEPLIERVAAELTRRAAAGARAQ